MDIQNANRPCVMGVTHTVAAGHYIRGGYVSCGGPLSP